MRLANWKQCTEDDYWQSEGTHVTIVCVTISDCQYFYTEDNTPYTWDYYVQMEAKYINVPIPKE